MVNYKNNSWKKGGRKQMSKFIETITPKDTEEVKPGLFIQKGIWARSLIGKALVFAKILKPKPDKEFYRMVHPGAWDGKINWKNFILGGNPIKHLFIFLLILFVAWSYLHDRGEFRDFYIEVMDDPIKWCGEVDKLKELPECTQELEDLGMCYTYNYNIP